jgi:signal transduction histidine kinase
VRLPIRARLTLLAGGLTAAVVLILGLLVYVRFEADLLESLDEGLHLRAEALVADSDPAVRIEDSGNPAEPAEGMAQLLDADDRVVVASAGVLVAFPPPSDAAPVEGTSVWNDQLPTPSGPVPVRLVAIPTDGGGWLVVGGSLEDMEAALVQLAGVLLVGGAVATVLASLVGWLVSGAALRPVERLRAEADAISASELDRRLAVPPTGDELARLADSLNRLLARLSEAVDRERQFVTAASHELRTPLTNLKAELDLAQRRDRTPDELAAVVRSASAETDRLVRLAEDLLVQARSEGGRLPLQAESTDLDELVADTVAGFAGRAIELGVDLRAIGRSGVVADVDQLRLRQAIGNLLDNALRHTPRGGTVTVHCAADPETAVITVEDTGSGFPAGESPEAGGSGLGLVIARAIAEAHGGRTTAANRPEGGAVVSIALPLAERT